MMDKVPVVIVGAGPSGLAMALALARYHIRSIILERDPEITTDPRGVYLNGDAVRILWDLGLRHQFKDIGDVVTTVNFHRTSFSKKPFFTMDGLNDFLNQSLPNGVAHVQPKLESALAQLIEASGFCTLRRGCTVESRTLRDDGMEVWFRDEIGCITSVRCSWLIGADGKKGIVRKDFLEPCGIIQEDGIYNYEGTWIAANLRIELPTADSHPDLPFWNLGMTPEQVYKLYWPEGWHFCTPPGKATASGRFGPPEDRLWRHELAEPNWNESMDALELLWQHLTPMVTRDRSDADVYFPNGPLTYPKDCVKVLRCRRFTFSHKVVNRWFDGRCVLIGDAAHVFPPFGGEGIASGIRDAHQLAWRIALVEQTHDISKSTISQILSTWASERRTAIDKAAVVTRQNGTMCNEPESWKFYFLRQLHSLYQMIPGIARLPDPRTQIEAEGFKGVAGSFFLPEYRGGGKLAQIFVQSARGTVYLSDELLRNNESALTLLVIGQYDDSRYDAAKTIVHEAHLPSTILSKDSIVCLIDETSDKGYNSDCKSFYAVSPVALSGLPTPRGYDKTALRDRLGPDTRYAILRPDHYIYALLENDIGLRQALNQLSVFLGRDTALGIEHTQARL